MAFINNDGDLLAFEFGQVSNCLSQFFIMEDQVFLITWYPTFIATPPSWGFLHPGLKGAYPDSSKSILRRDDNHHVSIRALHQEKRGECFTRAGGGIKDGAVERELVTNFLELLKPCTLVGFWFVVKIGEFGIVQSAWNFFSSLLEPGGCLEAIKYCFG